MQLVSPPKGYKVRKNALAKLREVADRAPNANGGVVRGGILANDDGTFTPCVFLTGGATILATYFAHNGIYTIG